MIFYYSGCGNSRHIAQQLAHGLGEQLPFIPELTRKGFGRYRLDGNETLGFVFPVYSWAAPTLVEQFILDTKWEGTPRHVWFACTCGDEMGYTRRIFEQTLRKAGLPLHACYCFIMPETYLAFPFFHLDTPERAEAKIKAADAKLPRVTDEIRTHQNTYDEHIGPLPYIKSYLIRPLFTRYMSDKKYHVGTDCTGCGKCAKVCPLKNITPDPTGRPKWNHHCTQCMACYHHCPHNAIHISTYTKGKGQYHYTDSKT